MAEWWEVGDTTFDLGGQDYSSWYDPGYGGDFNYDFPDFSFDFSVPDFNFAMPDFNVPDINFGPIPDFSFDPGMYDLGFDPSFGLDQYNFDVGDPFALPQGDLDLPTLSLGQGQSGGFDLWGAGAGSVPWLDYNPSIMADLSPGSLDQSLNFPAFEPADLGLSSMLGSNVGGGFDPNFAFSEAGNTLVPADYSKFQEGFGDQTDDPYRYYDQYQGGERPPPFDVKEPKTQAELDADLRRGAVEAQMFSNKWSPWAMGGQAAAPLLGGLLQAFGPGPKRPQPTDLERRRAEAEIMAIEAKIALEKEALRLKALEGGGGGGGGGMEAPEDPRLAIAEIQAQVAREQMAMEAETAEKLRRRPLMELDPRFSTLYNETTQAQQGLSPENADIQSMTQQIYSVRMQGLQQEFARQRDQIVERANRLGHNPAAEMAQINEAEQKAMSAVMVEAQQAALAFAQERLQPSTALLDAILKTVV